MFCVPSLDLDVLVWGWNTLHTPWPLKETRLRVDGLLPGLEPTSSHEGGPQLILNVTLEGVMLSIFVVGVVASECCLLNLMLLLPVLMIRGFVGLPLVLLKFSWNEGRAGDALSERGLRWRRRERKKKKCKLGTYWLLGVLLQLL